MVNPRGGCQDRLRSDPACQLSVENPGDMPRIPRPRSCSVYYVVNSASRQYVLGNAPITQAVPMPPKTRLQCSACMGVRAPLQWGPT